MLMKRFTALLIILAFLIPAFAYAEETVSFSDPVFEFKFRQQIGRPAGDIYISDCEPVTELFLSNAVFPEEERYAVKEEDKIRSLEDLDKFPNLVALNYANNAVSDISPMAQLKMLEMIEGPVNYVEDLNPLAELTGLVHVVFWENRIETVDALQNLNNLQVLSLFNNRITDISVLSDKTNLTVLELSGNPIEDFSPVDGILGQLEFADIGPNAGEGPVEESEEEQTGEEPFQNDEQPAQNDSDIDASGVPDTPLVFDDPMFERALRDAMDIHDRPITQKDAYGVREIDIHNDKSEGAMFSDISPLQYFVNLERLTFNSNLISDLSPLAGLEKLTMLTVAYNQVSDITPLANLVNLNELYLGYNQISDISALAGLTELRRLNLEENMLESVLPLQYLTKLESVKVWLVQIDPEGAALLVQHPNLYEVVIHMTQH